MRQEWTNTELKLLFELHAHEKPKLNSIVELFPKHTRQSIQRKAQVLGLRKPRKLKRPKLPPAHQRWMQIANEYWARRRTETAT